MCWGKNLNGQLGDGNFTNSAIPHNVTNFGIGSTKFIAASKRNTCLVNTTGGVYCVGYDNYLLGRCIINTSSNIMAQIPGLTSGYETVSMGAIHACALSTTGSVVTCWGYGGAGMMGRALDDRFCRSPATVLILPVNSIVTQVALGDLFTCTLLSTTQTMCFGFDTFGQMGQGTFNSIHVFFPVLVGNVGVKEIACGGDSNSGTICLVYFDKSINCSGSGSSGQLGNGQFQNTNIFGQVLGLSTLSPTGLPTISPTGLPTGLPTFSPSRLPTGLSTFSPTGLPTFSPARLPTRLPTSMNTECVPNVGLNKEQCLQKVSTCGTSNSMKWTGKGCTIAGVKQMDGGCQCMGYCGYTCRGACHKDKECVWIPALKTCVNKVTGVGGPKPKC
jgi:alpha-tubulin suppressor-like RCC1 family protein